MCTDNIKFLAIRAFTLVQNVPSIYRFQRTQDSSSVLTLTCETRTAPPTNITWQRDGVNLTVDGSTIQMWQTVTNRQSSYFTSTLSITDDPDNVIGTYRVIVGSSFGESTSSNISFRGNQCLTMINNVLLHKLFFHII